MKYEVLYNMKITDKNMLFNCDICKNKDICKYCKQVEVLSLSVFSSLIKDDIIPYIKNGCKYYEANPVNQYIVKETSDSSSETKSKSNPDSSFKNFLSSAIDKISRISEKEHDEKQFDPLSDYANVLKTGTCHICGHEGQVVECSECHKDVCLSCCEEEEVISLDNSGPNESKFICFTCSNQG